MTEDVILVVDDEPQIRRVVRNAFTATSTGAGARVIEAANGRDAIDLAAAQRPTLIVLDLGLPDVSGEVVLQEVRRRSDVPILVLSARGRMEERVRGLGLGADDYLPKPFSPLELVARVKALLRRAGGQPGARDLLAFDARRLEIDTVRHEVRIEGAPRDVTRSEFDLLHVLAQHPGRVYTRAEIAYRLRGHDFDGDERLIDVHVRNLRRKIEVDPRRPRCIETVRGVGYRLGVEPA
jgi:DNA-binding response OmpR family regulator